MCDCDYDYPKVMRQKSVKARKEHYCCECLAIIPKGDFYLYTSGVWDDPMDFKTCNKCSKIYKFLDKNKECYGFGMLYEAVEPFEKLYQYFRKIRKVNYDSYERTRAALALVERS